jgi:C4-dicarboxylate-specific signal transduction histidine kinase
LGICQEDCRGAVLKAADLISNGWTGELAGSIAHEVNQPLAAVVTNAEA